MDSSDQLGEHFQIAVTRAETAVAEYRNQPDSPRHFAYASQRLDAALTLGLQLFGADRNPGPAVVAQMRARYGATNQAALGS